MSDVFSGDEVIGIVENQLADKNPLIVTETLMRLMMTGHSREDAIELIACALTVELHAVVQQEEVFNAARYASNLKELPDLSFMVE